MNARNIYDNNSSQLLCKRKKNIENKKEKVDKIKKKKKQRINGPVNAHLISGPTISTKTSFAKFNIFLIWVTVSSGVIILYTLCRA